MKGVFGDKRLSDRFWKKLKISRAGCWLWQGSKTSKGYGTFYLGKDTNGRQVTGVPHKMTWLLNHKLPKFNGVRTVLDHKCRRRACCNPAHLEAVPEPVNVARGNSPSARNAAVKACPRGHRYTPKNTYVWRRGNCTKRYCRKCRRK